MKYRDKGPVKHLRRTAMASMLAVVLACGESNNESTAELNIPVNVEAVGRSDIAAYISTTGTVQPRFEERVLTEVDGIITFSGSLGVGSSVSKGQVLAEITNPEYLLDVRVESQKMAMDNAQRELEKQEALFDEGGVTEKDLETARRTALDARLNHESAQLRAKKTQVVAPISGVVTGLQTSANGTRIVTGFQICTLVNYSTVEIPVKLPNTDLGFVSRGQETLVSNYALPDDVFTGQVHSIDPAIDPQTRTFTTTVRVKNATMKMRPGMFVKVDIIREQHPDAIVISKEALQIRDNRSVVFVVEGVMAEMREINTGIETRETIEVLAGLGDGERLVVKGHETLRDKSRVRVME